MNRTLSVKRLWSMGPFNNVEFSDQIREIPEEIALNRDSVGLLYSLMVLEQEMAHKEYLKIFKKYPLLLKMFPDNLDFLDETILAIKEEKSKTFEEFMNTIRKETQE